ncbi:TPR repeat containing Spindly family protein [Cyanobium sp. PCC 7001]|uniref:tetratricopeptide repeat protein n=1 Tax=Cyanobium sp. PCC 7001 TaxID=180281 RepID=UPI0001804ED2|nr:tetratricopeptide repeat protein [Cyanobium sp. PCC 7001]EDY37739.1 TPR repeat containing Spindly family protein [Cyanobium sp. PCC 7001]
MFPSAALSQTVLVVPEGRWLLRPVPKASSTLLKRLAVIAEGRRPPEQAAFGETRPALAVHHPALHGLTRLADLDPAALQQALHGPDWLRLAVTRHPAERLLSFWHDKLHLAEPAYAPLNASIQQSAGEPPERPCRFPAFLAFLDAHWDELRGDGHLTPQFTLLEPGAIAWQPRLDREQLAERLPALLEQRLPPRCRAALKQELSRHGRLHRQRLGRRWQEAFSADGLAIVARRYGDDLAAFGYSLPERAAARVRPLAAADSDALVDPLGQLRDRNRQIAALQIELAAAQQQLAEARAALERPPLPATTIQPCRWPPHNAPEAGLGHLYQALAENRFTEVIDQADGLAAHHPHAGELHYLAGVAAHMQGRHDEAIRRFEAAQAAGFLTPYLLFNAGNACRSRGDTGEGLRLYREALALLPDFPECRHNLALGLIEAGRPEEAEATLRLLLRDQPSWHQAAFQLANLLRSQRREAEAVEAFRLCLQFAPAFPDAWNNLGLAQEALGQRDEAIAYYRQALSIDAGFRPSRQNLAQSLVRQRRHEEALEEFGRFLALDLDVNQQVVGLQGRLGCLCELDRIEQALAEADAQPDPRVRLITRLHVLPVLYRSDAQLAETRTRWAADLQALYDALEGLTAEDPAWPALHAHAWAITNFYLAYQMEDDRPLQELYAGVLDRILRPRLGRFMAPLQQRDPHDPSPLRVGVISPHLINHNGSIWALGWLEGIAAKPGFEIFSYNLAEDEDSGTQRFASLGTYRHLPLRSEDPEPMLQRILDDQLDLLIFTDIGMHPASKVTSVLQLAPVQAQGWGHPITSGSRTMHYFFGAAGMEPPGNEAHYSEELIRLPGTGLHYATPAAVHDGQLLFEKFDLPRGRPLLVSLQSTFKYVPRNDWTYAEIAARHPEALILLVGPLGHPAMAQRLAERLKPHFERRGVAMDDHLRILPRLEYGDFMGLFDIAHHTLDTIDWNGGNSSFQSFSRDCPVLTCPTAFMRGRHTVAMLQEMKIPELIAESREAYVATSLRLLQDPGFHAHVKGLVRERKSRLFNDRRVVEAFQAAVEELGRKPPGAGQAPAPGQRAAVVATPPGDTLPAAIANASASPAPPLPHAADAA